MVKDLLPLKVPSTGDDIDPSPSFGRFVRGKERSTCARGPEFQDNERYTRSCSFVSALVGNLSQAGKPVMVIRSSENQHAWN